MKSWKSIKFNEHSSKKKTEIKENRIEYIDQSLTERDHTSPIVYRD
jgi:hypothetical protein